MREFEVIVVGGGHAGYEAANAAVRLGKKTLLISSNLERLGYLSCNPAIGGLAKGQLVKEVDGLGGMIGRIADATAIQFRTLNRGRGPAVRAVRTQNDRVRFAQAVGRELHELARARETLQLLAGEVNGILVEQGRVTGVRVREHGTISGERVILACGTFLNGLIHIGLEQFPAGRLGDPPALGLTESLVQAGLRTARLKTGTPPRLNGTTIDYTRMVRYTSEAPPPFFTPETREPALKQLPCHLTHTTKRTAEVIKANLDQSPLYSGRIQGIGPRYCPSIEDKIVKYPQHEIHQIFIEPEGIETEEVYVNGISTSLPKNVQIEIVKSVDGLENGKIVQYGYAIEYDFFPPEQLEHTLESKRVKGLYFAGQINGTSGYEEAAAQGIMAGINAAKNIENNEPLVLSRSEAYIGVLIDDLVTQGTDEPYRMFTSRAEHRLTLRDDNALFRMHPFGMRVGMIGEARNELVTAIMSAAEQELIWLGKNRPDRERRRQLEISEEKEYTLLDVCRRPEIGYRKVASVYGRTTSEMISNYLESEIRYEGYIERETRLNQARDDYERKKIPSTFNYATAEGLSVEARQKLTRRQPPNLAVAGRISGVSPADIHVLAVYLKRGDDAANS